MAIGTQPLDDDAELAALRQAWGRELGTGNIQGLAKAINNVEHKLRAVRYHRGNLERFEQAAIERFQEQHVPPAGVAVEMKEAELLFEVEGFLYQVKSCLDMLAKVLSAAGLRSIGHTFGDHGDHVLKQLSSVPNPCTVEANELQALIAAAQPAWLDSTVTFRDEIAHEGMLDRFRCFVQQPTSGPGEVSVHYPQMPDGERATAYVQRVERELHAFVNAFVGAAIRIAATLQNRTGA